MKLPYLGPLGLLLVLLFVCTHLTLAQADSHRQEKVLPTFGAILDSLDIVGSILVLDHHQEVFYSNDFDWARAGFIPASTFKIPHSLIAVETGVLKDENHIFHWDGQKRSLANWEQDLTLKQAFQFSCVPCYQQVAREIGPETMRRYLDSFNYGETVFDATQIDSFWLRGASKISPFEQIDFLEHMYFDKLDLSPKTVSVVKGIMNMEEIFGGVLSGKTGLSSTAEATIGWFVGYVEVAGDVYFFATNVQPKSSDTADFNAKRILSTKLALETILRR